MKAQHGEPPALVPRLLQSCRVVFVFKGFFVGSFSARILGHSPSCVICLSGVHLGGPQTSLWCCCAAPMFPPRSCGFPAVKRGNPSATRLLSALICAANLLTAKFSNRAAPASTLD